MWPTNLCRDINSPNEKTPHAPRSISIYTRGTWRVRRVYFSLGREFGHIPQPLNHKPSNPLTPKSQSLEFRTLAEDRVKGSEVWVQG